MSGIRCTECDQRSAVLVTGKVLYPHRPDLYGKSFYRCPCGAYVGCHPGTNKPLGSCAGPATRAARSRAHAAFDPLWRDKVMKRGAAYAALAKALHIDPHRCHISWMGQVEADRVPAAVHTIIAEQAK